MKDNTLLTNHVNELLYQALETEKGGVQIYTTSLRCATNQDLKKECRSISSNKNHVQVLHNVLTKLGPRVGNRNAGPKDRAATSASL